MVKCSNIIQAAVVGGSGRVFVAIRTHVPFGTGGNWICLLDGHGPGQPYTAWRLVTPWNVNIAAENRSSKKESSLATIILQGLC